jgi:hypothetical protein
VDVAYRQTLAEAAARIEFKPVDGDEFATRWWEWYPWMKYMQNMRSISPQ